MSLTDVFMYAVIAAAVFLVLPYVVGVVVVALGLIIQAARR